MEYEILPKKYWHIHDYLLYAYDVLRDMLEQAENKNLGKITIQFKDKIQEKTFKNTDDCFKWMDDNGFHVKSLGLFSAHLFFELLRDFCFYTYESLRCAKRGKVTVAYTLMRKPFRDNLLYMEWLLADVEGFYHALLYENIDQYDISNNSIFSKTRIQEIIDVASRKTKFGHSLNGSNIIYSLRFDRNDDICLQRIWDQSIHLVTQNSKYRTNKTNLNFIFADQEIWHEYWGYYYTIMPQLMAYVVEVAELLFLKTEKVDELNLQFNRFIRLSKFSKAYKNNKPLKMLRNQPYKILKKIKEYNYKAYFICEFCKKPIHISEILMQKIIDDYFIVCPSCNQIFSICKYYTEIKCKYRFSLCRKGALKWTKKQKTS